MAAAIVVVFDFDKTIIDVDSDNWVIDELGFTDLFNQLLPTMPWNSLMDRMMKELHSDGKTMEDIAEVLKRIPIHSQVISAIKAAHDLGCELRIVSSVDEEGRLRISPHHDFTQSSHGCTLCPPNMCKGLIIERIQASISKEGSKKIIYLGDGAGDYCPSLKLTEADYVMPRKNFPAWALISKNPLLVKAEIHEWIDGGEMERVLLQIIERISREEIGSNSAQLFSADCKLQTTSIGSHGASPQALSVTQ
ncbi:INORGANIC PYROPHOSPHATASE [Salix viminalis]|uniref:INORGANIC PYROPHOSPHATASE n=1 Tax=Salix viminalis TaxID=40686 RepID=A0A9Q0YXQ0_SALVM|nr:INORGANIC PYROPHOSPHATASE [Salix viminalis]